MNRPRTYKPRRAGARWLEGAPAEILDVWDNGGRTFDRVTVYFFGNGYGHAGEHAGDTIIDYLALSETGLGFSQWGEITAETRAQLAYYKTAETGRRVRWLDLPADVRTHVLWRMAEAAQVAA